VFPVQESSFFRGDIVLKKRKKKKGVEKKRERWLM
jgi:hypothetical protein